MVRFHLVGLIAVGLAIQFPSALASFDSTCKIYADSSNVGHHYNCTRLAQAARHPPASIHEYASKCLCENEIWYIKYETCLQEVTAPRWKKNIQDDMVRRCTTCANLFPDKPLKYIQLGRRLERSPVDL
ncbi:BZ3500_MvSof-1268-A1-R1_Chr4-4g07559 [Microbotryum saponariae]|uniref:BZ3500_MvSof-1268-A1-R1_Chr4-4g07559 protein n=1 Tax=Microbotryum saponariae TaxID=289078 RepID=A0A2X0LKL1_9BASI|nr:BZ3500_MvSof-1268-A1-R1_Chr4-4g07559 [Microbotryum saponariae]SDA07220.1 BZ3501_MvSof-1269-A2-R1_Chr4-3g07267 [Microbotryum saponariae]